MKIGILVVAYNAASTLAAVLDRIPVDFRPHISEVIVSDDHSQDSTYLVGLGYQQLSDLPITVIRQPANLGYGGNQKACYQVAIDHGLDVVVLLHGDGQYAPECLPQIVAPILDGEADAVFGSRVMVKGAARKGGMPLYKYVGNRILTRFENAVLGTDLTEFHSGYRAYRVDALEHIPFERNADGFNFDTQIIIQLHDAGKRIVEVAHPHVLRRRDLLRGRHALRGRRHEGRGGVPAGQGGVRRRLSRGAVRGVPAQRERGQLPRPDLRARSGRARRGRSSTSAAPRGPWPSVCSWPGTTSPAWTCSSSKACTSGWASSSRPISTRASRPQVGTGFDIVLAADVLEHVRRPESLLREMRALLRASGTAVICVPNVAHWYPRFRSLLGAFDYDQRGILDRTHLRFFTRRSIRRLVEREGFTVRRLEAVGLPLDALDVKGAGGRVMRALDHLFLTVWPTMFGYQFILELAPQTNDRR